ncbi:hypothetical protein GCM10020367_68740 [Streptomyces sannanensis]|uniref:SCP domain-containing protein n=1 Tax=Streptomyces sannanensis TaxID=285536 RepID=A0ABP6SNQ6_9ACTN
MTTSHPRRRARRIAVAVCALTATLTAIAPTASAAPTPPAAPATTTAEAAREYYPNVDWIVCEVNKTRKAKDLPGLLVSDQASNVARSHTQDMSRMGKLTSVGSDGRDLRTRLSDAGIFSNYIAEYMFYGYNHDGYFADMATDPDPHNAFYKDLMSADIAAIGIGYHNRYWDVDLVGPHRRLDTRPAACTGE